MTVPFSQQYLKRDLAEDIQSDLKRGRAVSGDELLHASSSAWVPFLSDFGNSSPLSRAGRLRGEDGSQSVGLVKISP